MWHGGVKAFLSRGEVVAAAGQAAVRVAVQAAASAGMFNPQGPKRLGGATLRWLNDLALFRRGVPAIVLVHTSFYSNKWV